MAKKKKQECRSKKEDIRNKKKEDLPLCHHPSTHHPIHAAADDKKTRGPDTDAGGKKEAEGRRRDAWVGLADVAACCCEMKPRYILCQCVPII